ncbi:MAG: hypothetical protein AAF480_08830 [Actinomycetota bacterium]
MRTLAPHIGASTKKLLATAAVGAVLVGACASGAGSRTVPEALTVDAAASVEAGGSTSESPPDDVVDLTAAQPPDPAAVARCEAIVGEVERRETQGLLEEEDDDGVELSEEEIERFQHEPPAVDGGVMGPEERPEHPQMPDRIDLGTVVPEDLFIALEACFENRVLQDGFDDEGADAEFCAELAGLSAEEVAEWVAEEGDQVVDEEFAWCELARPDRQ